MLRFAEFGAKRPCFADYSQAHCQQLGKDSTLSSAKVLIITLLVPLMQGQSQAGCQLSTCWPVLWTNIHLRKQDPQLISTHHLAVFEPRCNTAEYLLLVNQHISGVQPLPGVAAAAPDDCMAASATHNGLKDFFP